VNYIADASVFILKLRPPGKVITVPSIVKELRDWEAKLFLEILGTTIEEPSLDMLREVKGKASMTRDIEELSKSDLELLAKALEYGKDSVLLTDDYAVQNVAVQLGIKIETIAQERIRDILIWEKQCLGCKRRYPRGDICPVCGSKLKKKRRRS
jgi:UPF0271 protein